MAELYLVRHPEVQVTEQDRQAARRVLFSHIDGLGEAGQKQWRRFVNGLFKLEPGEMVKIQTHQERLGWFHRKHMAMEAAIFESQERFPQFKSFRDWLKVGAGHCDWFPGPKGGVFPVPKSISYAKMDQSEMELFHRDALEFLKTPYAQKTLWPHSPEEHRGDALDFILAQFGGL